MKTFFLCSGLSMPTKGAGLDYANVAGIIRVYREITCFKVHIASRLNWRGGSGLGLVPAVFKDV